MSLTDVIRRKKNRPVNGADPSQAFGAEELTMEEIQRQTFVPPEKKAPGFAQRAGVALNNLRSLIVGDEGEPNAPLGEEQRPPREEAPVYSAENYQNENAPDLGWENPFAEPSPAGRSSGSVSSAGVASARTYTPRAQASNARSYTGSAEYAPSYGESEYREPPYQSPVYPEAQYQQPIYPEPAYPEQGYREPSYSPPVYGDTEAYSSPSRSGPRNGQSARRSYSSRERYAPPAVFYGAPGYAQPQEPWDAEPAAQETLPPDAFSQDPYLQDAYGYSDPYSPRGFTPQSDEIWDDGGRIPTPRRPARPKSEPGDFKYMFWSGGIVLGMFLTLASFIYGCVV